MKDFFKLAIDAFAAVRQQRERNRLVDQLDERTLRDIGLEHEANRARERSQRVIFRFGVY